MNSFPKSATRQRCRLNNGRHIPDRIAYITGTTDANLVDPIASFCVKIYIINMKGTENTAP